MTYDLRYPAYYFLAYGCQPTVRPDLEYTYGDTIPAPPPCPYCEAIQADSREYIDMLHERERLAAQTIAQLQHEIASLRAVLLRPMPDGM